MTLNDFVCQARKQIHGELISGLQPSYGEFSEATLAEARAVGEPRMGSVRFEPQRVSLEFIFGSAAQSAVFEVAVTPPERIVFLPVPGWVVESIWQGEIDGSYHFESHAVALYEAFRAELGAEANSVWFGPRQPKRRE